MAPKKGQKMSLNEFLGDQTLGSWADEMDAFPTAPSNKPDDGFRGSGLGGRGADRGDRPNFPPREDVPLPTKAPFTAFVGNLPFDLTESQLEDHFAPHKVVSVKIIKDREDRPKGFGYVEFETVDGLKHALDRGNSTLAGRLIRVNVADPPKERDGRYGGSGEELTWRRDGPPPSATQSTFERRGSRFESEEGGFGGRSERRPFSERPPPAPSAADQDTNWRAGSSRFAQAAPPEESGPPRRGSKFGRDFNNGPPRSESDSAWRRDPPPPSSDKPEREFGRSFSGGPRERNFSQPLTAADENKDWRARKVTPTASAEISRQGSQENSPSAPAVRKKLDILPRSGPTVASPLGSPKSAASPKLGPVKDKSANPFGAAKPIDVAAREKEVAERIANLKIKADEKAAEEAAEREKEREEKEKAPKEQPAAPAPTNWRSAPRETQDKPAEKESTWQRGGPKTFERGSSSKAPTILSRDRPAPSNPPPPQREAPLARAIRAPPPPAINRDPILERKTSGSAPASGTVKPAFSFASAAGGGGNAWRKATPAQEQPKQQPSPPESVQE